MYICCFSAFFVCRLLQIYFSYAMDTILPVEIQEKILWYLRHDSLTMHRVENVCTLWANLVQFFERYKRLHFRRMKIVKRLTTTESFNESFTIQKIVNKGRCQGLIAERAEKVFMTHMELIRLKYPQTLHNLQSNGVSIIYPRMVIKKPLFKLNCNAA